MQILHVLNYFTNIIQTIINLKIIESLFENIQSILKKYFAKSNGSIFN